MGKYANDDPKGGAQQGDWRKEKMDNYASAFGVWSFVACSDAHEIDTTDTVAIKR